MLRTLFGARREYYFMEESQPMQPPIAEPRSSRRLKPIQILTSKQQTLEVEQALHALLVIFTAFLAIALVVVLQLAREVFVPIVVALLLYFLLVPVVRVLRRFRLPASIAALLVLTGLLGLLFLIALQLSQPLSHWSGRVPEAIYEVRNGMRDVRAHFHQLRQAEEAIASVDLDGAKQDQKVELRESTLTDVIVKRGGEAIGYTLTIIVLLFFMLSTGDQLLLRSVEIAPTLRDKKRVVFIARQIEANISLYLLTITTINILLGVVMAAAMWAMALPNPYLWGAMACVLNFIPYLGALLGAAVVFVVALLSKGDFMTALSFPAVYLLINSLEGHLLTPAALGRRMQLHPVLLLCWFLLWFWLWGIPGALLAIPLLAVFKIICDSVDALRPIAQLLSAGRVVTEPSPD